MPGGWASCWLQRGLSGSQEGVNGTHEDTEMGLLGLLLWSMGSGFQVTEEITPVFGASLLSEIFP